jgi:hypothetical protein
MGETKLKIANENNSLGSLHVASNSITKIMTEPIIIKKKLNFVD